MGLCACSIIIIASSSYHSVSHSGDVRLENDNNDNNDNDNNNNNNRLKALIKALIRTPSCAKVDLAMQSISKCS